MENRNILAKNLSISAIIILAVFMRIMPHLPNATPVAAMALYSGFSLKGWKAYALPLLVMLVSDVVIGFHSTMLFVYGSFIIIVFFGHLLETKTFMKITGVTVLSSLIFFTITNFGVWLTSSMYVKDLSGLLQAYVMGLPFLRNTLIGDFVYTYALFYGCSYAERIIAKYTPKLAVKEV